MSIITDKANELGELIKADERFIKYEQLKQEQAADEALQEKISDFNLKRISLSNEMQKDERDDEKVKQIEAQMQELYNDIMSVELMVEFSKASKEFEDLINSVYTILNYHITGEQPGSCSGSCSSCSGCNH